LAPECPPWGFILMDLRPKVASRRPALALTMAAMIGSVYTSQVAVPRSRGGIPMRGEIDG